MLPVLVPVAIVLAAILFLAMNPERIGVIRSRISAMRTPNPAPAAAKENDGAPDALHGASFQTGELELVIPDVPEPVHDPVESDTVTGDLHPSIGKITAGTPPEENVAEPVAETETSAEIKSDGEVVKRQAEQEQAAVTMGYLSVNVEPEAEILIDGMHRIHGASLGPLELSPGEHEVVCRKQGYREYRERVSIKRDELSRRNIILQQINGAVRFITDAGARIFIDGSYRGNTPLDRPITLTAGEHRIELRKVGCKNWENVVSISADETLRLRITLVPR